MKRLIKTDWLVLVCLLAAVLILTGVAGYTVGVVSQNQVIAQIDSNIGSVEAYLEKNQNNSEQLLEEFKEDYIAKTRTIAMLLSQDTSFMTDDRTLEELRVTVNADRISVSDTDGGVTASTDPSGEGNTIREEFMPHLSETVYTDVLFLLDSNSPTIVAASALGEAGGLVQITYPADSMVSILQEADFANIAVEMPLYPNGETAILRADSMEYISCTTSDKIGETMTAYASQIEKKKGKFDVVTDDGEKAMLHYQMSGDYVILAIVPYTEIYHMRNVVMEWIVISGMLILAVSCLALRMQILQQEKRK